MRQLLLLISVELKEYIREPGVIFWAILFPILLALGLGVAFSGSGDQDRTIAVICSAECDKLDFMKESNPTRKIGNENLGFITYKFVKTDWDEAVLMLKKGKTGLVMENSGEGVKYHFDPNNADAKYSYLQLSDFLNGENRNEEEISVLKQEGTRYIDFLVPGLMAMGIMMSCMWGISYSNVERRSKKLLRRMVATPMKKYYYVLSQLAGRVIMSAMEALMLIGTSMLVFGIKISGSLVALGMMFLAGNILFGGLAWLMASRTSKTQIANGLINLVIMPMMIMSGIYFSYHNFPDAMVTVIQYLPLTVLADNIRSIFIEGAGVWQVMPGFAILSTGGVILLAVGIRIYRWY